MFSKQKLGPPLIFCCLITLLSCGGTSNTSPSVNAPSSVLKSTSGEYESSTEIGAGNLISQEEAGVQYSQIVRPFGCALADWMNLQKQFYIGNAQVDGSKLPEMKSAVSKVATLRNSTVEELVTSNWPESVRADIENVSLFWASVAKVEKVLSESMDISSWNKNIQSYRTFASSSENGLSKIIRIKLGLPEFSPSEC